MAKKVEKKEKCFCGVKGLTEDMVIAAAEDLNASIGLDPAIDVEELEGEELLEAVKVGMSEVYTADQLEEGTWKVMELLGIEAQEAPEEEAPAPKKAAGKKAPKKAEPEDDDDNDGDDGDDEKPAPKKGKAKGKAKGKKSPKTVRTTSNLTTISRNATVQALAPRFAQAMSKTNHNSYNSLFEVFREQNPDIQLGDMAFRRLCREVGVTSSHRLSAAIGSPLAYHLGLMYDPKTGPSTAPTPPPPAPATTTVAEDEDRVFDNDTRTSGPAQAVHPAMALAQARQADEFAQGPVVST